jgi:acylphosphatase
MSTDSSGAKARAHLKIGGRVQGVYYRYSMVREAQNLGLTGWVRNLEDGSVEAVAEGERANIEALIAWSRQGPAGARVDRVDVQWQFPGESFSGFVVRR